MKKRILVTAVTAVLASGFVHAQETPAPAPTPAPALAVAGQSDISFSGYVEASYNYLSKGNTFTSGSATRAFDLEKNDPAIRQIAFTLSKQPKEGFGGLLNVTGGKDADILNAYGLGAGHKNKIDLTQAYLQYATGPFTVIGGKFATLAGAEVNTSPNNNNYSRSYLFQLGPYTHTGVRGTYALNDQLSLIAGVNNGWDDFKETNSAKTVELGLSYTPSKIFSLTTQGYTGKERVNGLTDAGPEGTRNFIDVVGTYNATDKLTFAVNAAYGSQGNAPLASGTTGTAKWSGIAGYATYQINSQWRVAGRLEYFDDKDGNRTGIAQQLKEATLTLAYLPTKAVELRTEVRADRSNTDAFVDSSGATSKSQHSFGVQAIYKF